MSSSRRPRRRRKKKGDGDERKSNNSSGERDDAAHSYDEDTSARYAGSAWVAEVADKVVGVMAAARTFRARDLVLDFGCGPGVTLERLLHADGAPFASVPPRTAYMCDVSDDMVRLSRSLSSLRCPVQGVMCHRVEAFGSDGRGLRDEFMEWLPARLDVAYASLVTEYLTREQTVTLCRELLTRLTDGGMLALFDWAEHFAYPPGSAEGVEHAGGMPKSYWLGLAAELCDSVEDPDRVARQQEFAGGMPPGNRPRFPTPPAFRLAATVGTFLCERAHEQECASGDAVHYLVLVKEADPGGPRPAPSAARLLLEATGLEEDAAAGRDAGRDDSDDADGRAAARGSWRPWVCAVQ